MKTDIHIQDLIKLHTGTDYRDFFDTRLIPIQIAERADNHADTIVNINEPHAQRLDMLLKFNWWKDSLYQNPKFDQQEGRNPRLEETLEMSYINWLDKGYGMEWAHEEPIFMNDGKIDDESYKLFKENLAHIKEDMIEHSYSLLPPQQEKDPVYSTVDDLEAARAPLHKVPDLPPELPSRAELPTPTLPRKDYPASEPIKNKVVAIPKRKIKSKSFVPMPQNVPEDKDTFDFSPDQQQRILNTLERRKKNVIQAELESDLGGEDIKF